MAKWLPCLELSDFTLHESPEVIIFFAHPDLPELINIQNYKGKTQPYQLRQFVKLVEKYDLDRGEET